jgi:hypothetical protein
MITGFLIYIYWLQSTQAELPSLPHLPPSLSLSTST